MPKRIVARVVVLTASLSLCSCAGKQPRTGGVELPRVAPVQSFTFSTKAREARLAALVFDLPVGYDFGESSWGSYGSCARSTRNVITEGRVAVDVKIYEDVFNAEMKKHGYPVDDRAEIFKDSKERAPDISVGARVMEAKVNECYPNYFDNKLKVVGNVFLKVEWSAYSMLEKKVVFTAITEGTTNGNVESNVGQPGLLRPALADAAERLALTPAYRTLIDPPGGTAAPEKSAQRIRVRRAKLFAGELKANVSLIKQSVVTVTANRGSGSGFIISEDGSMITAEHVITGSKLVKVNTPAGKECYGEVVAVSKPRDLALVKLDCAGLVPLPITLENVSEGGEVFAVGTPMSDQLQFSVTKGVVSGLRRIDDLDYIQSDVTVLPGSSGGPLLDPHGNAIGVATAGIAISKVPVGVNFFIPLAGLSKYLPVDLE